MPKIKVIRTDKKTNRFQKVGLFLDGRKIGSIGTGERQEFDVPEGS